MSCQVAFIIELSNKLIKANSLFIKIFFYLKLVMMIKSDEIAQISMDKIVKVGVTFFQFWRIDNFFFKISDLLNFLACSLKQLSRKTNDKIKYTF